MRVIVAGWLEFAGQDCAAIIRGGAAHIAASRRERGCIAYDWAVDPLEAATVRVYEEWESEADLGRHFRDPSYAAMRDHLGASGLTGFDVKLYSVAGIAAVYDAEGRLPSEVFGVPIDVT